MIRPTLSLVSLASAFQLGLDAQTITDTTRQPADSVRLITRDIPSFWRAYDLAAGKDSVERVRIFRTVYLQPGSPGLRDWMRVRLMNRDTVRARLIAAGWDRLTIDSIYRLPRGTPVRDSLQRDMEPHMERSAAEQLLRALAQYPRWYAAVRPATLSIDSATAITQEIRRGLKQLAELYPDARFPDVYFLIGTLSTGGTVARSGMLIGTEQLTAGPDTPRDELPEWATFVTKENPVDRIPRMVVHEAVHTQQRPRPEGQKNTLLRQALGEGGADFLTELALGPPPIKTERQVYGEAHERSVWLDFKDEMMTDSTITTWMYNGRVPRDKNHGATDIGYWIGSRIARAYYDRATDKRAAVRVLLLCADPESILAASGYAASAETLPDE